MFHSTPENRPALERAVVAAAALHERRSCRDDGKYTRVFHLGDFDAAYPDLTVKYNDYVTIEPENLMLQHLYTLACEDGDAAPHVPQPVHCFRGPDHMAYMGYMVMGRIELRAVSDDELCTKAAGAVRWLRGKRPPHGVLFGSLGEHCAYHTIFKDFTAPPMLKNVAVAEKYFNTVVDKIRRPWNPIINVSLTNDDVVLTQSDMHACNFGVGLDGRAVLFDAATIQALPVTLADLTLLRTTPFATAVSQHVFGADERAALVASPSLKSLAEVRRFLIRTYDDTLGFDKDGNLRTRDRG